MFWKCDICFSKPPQTKAGLSKGSTCGKQTVFFQANQVFFIYSKFGGLGKVLQLKWKCLLVSKSTLWVPSWFSVLRGQDLLERSRPTPRASPSLIQRTMPLYSGMAQSSVTGWPAITTWSCGCCVNEDAWPGERKKEEASVLKRFFPQDATAQDAMIFLPRLKKIQPRGARRFLWLFYSKWWCWCFSHCDEQIENLLGSGDILFYSKYKRMLVENQDAPLKICYKTLRKTPDHCCFLFSQSIFATSIFLGFAMIEKHSSIKSFYIFFLIFSFQNECCGFQSGNMTIWHAQIQCCQFAPLISDLSL